MLEQGTDEWRMERLGKVTASRISDVMAKVKSGGYSATRANYMSELLIERLTGQPTIGYQSPEMARGSEIEPMARALYSIVHDRKIEQIGFVHHPTILMAGASPDGLIDQDGLVEIKCPNTATHVSNLLGKNVPNDYMLQCQFQMACTERSWCDLVSFDDRMPWNMQMLVRPIKRDPALILLIEEEVRRFLLELETKVTALREMYEEAA